MPEISRRLRERCESTVAGRSWLGRLPAVLCDLSSRWSLSLPAPFTGEDTSCAWVAPALRADGSEAVLKVAFPHFEGEHEIEGLRFWSGDPTVQLLDADENLGAMLLERCVPGATLRTVPEAAQDVVVSGLLRRLWRAPPPAHSFRPLATMLTFWTREFEEDGSAQTDPGLTRTALNLLEELARPDSADVLLATDLHAGNVLRAEREPWLVIDPKPFVGDPSYDATQHLLNCRARLTSAPLDTIRRFADLLELSAERIRLWMFVRAVIQPQFLGDASALARALKP